ncbi:unnamed protein product [Linum tenue]|uniref:Uncharacterized protein n=1 Tax=Linum tenue TaxID=586396 RepID=A0AAV0H2C2_9ROSI|nr:unnamed protein product [Linum tenue]
MSTSSSSDFDANGTPQVETSPLLRWFPSLKSAKKVSPSSEKSIIDGLKKLYRQKLEVTYGYNGFVSPLLTNNDFDAKPMVMVLGARIGTEPTTDSFVAVMSGPDDKTIPGNNIAGQPDMPFYGITAFGKEFMSKFKCSQMSHPLIKVHGTLLWSLARVLSTPEAIRVYTCSFEDNPIDENIVGPLGKKMIETDQSDLLSDIKYIPKKVFYHKINEFVKRARAAKIYAHIIGHLKKEMPFMIGSEGFSLSFRCFPNVEQFKEVLRGRNFTKFPRLKPKMIQAIDDIVAYEIPNLLKKARDSYD